MNLIHNSFTMLKFWLCLAVFGPLCVHAADDDYGAAGEGDDLLQETQLLDALQKLISFLESDMDKVNVDGLLGITVAEAQLNMVLEKMSIKSILFDKVIDLQTRCHTINKELKAKLQNSSDLYDSVYSTLLDTSVWELDHDFNKPIETLPLYNLSNPDSDELVDFIFNGAPSANQSENCIMELIKHTELGKEEQDCLPSKDCVMTMSNTNSSNGYPLTHKLLYVQLARSLKCKLNEEVMEDKIIQFCSRILQEYDSIFKIQQKNILLQDLYLEQMVLCGMEGYSEFLDDDSRHLLLVWQSEHGCYGGEDDNSMDLFRGRWRQKRSTQYMKFGCESHISGLAAAAITIHFNYLVSTSPTDAQVDDELDDFSNILMFK